MKLISTDFINTYFKYIEGLISIKVSYNVKRYVENILVIGKNYDKQMFFRPFTYVNQDIISIINQIKIYYLIEKDAINKINNSSLYGVITASATASAVMGIITRSASGIA